MYDVQIDVDLKKPRQRKNYYIVGKIQRGNRRFSVSESTRTSDLAAAASYLAAWAEDQKAQHAENKRADTLRKAGVDDARATITVRDAIAYYHERRAKMGKPITVKFEADNLWRFEQKYGARLIYDISPEMAEDIAAEFLPDVTAATRRRYGTSLIAALYNAVARKHTSFEKRTWQHERSITERRPAASAEWVNEFLSLANQWQPTLQRFQIGRVYYDPDPHAWRVMVKTAVMFLFTTASRIGETSKIKWGDVDFSNRRLVIHAANRKYQQSVHKMLTADVVAALQTLATLIPSHPDLLVFPFLHAHSPAKSINKRIRQICGDRLPVLTSHEIGGHGCVSALLEAGLTPRAIAELVGKDEGTISHYGNTTDRVKIETVDRVFGENCTHFAI